MKPNSQYNRRRGASESYERSPLPQSDGRVGIRRHSDGLPAPGTPDAGPGPRVIPSERTGTAGISKNYLNPR